MSAVLVRQLKRHLSTVELAAETALALDADARRYAQRTQEMQVVLLHGQEQRRAAWAGQHQKPGPPPLALAL